MISLQRYAKFANGQLAVYRGDVSATPHVFTLDNLTVLSPVFVTLRAPASSGVTLRISKFAEEPLREVPVGAEGEARVSFRTEGGFYARVSGKGPAAPYALYVVVGDAVAPPLPPVTITYAEFERRAKEAPAAPGGAPVTRDDAGASGARPAAGAPAPASPGSGGSLVQWVIAGALVVIIALLAVLVMRRNKA